ncbi:MAG: IclR family transcriptional regulator [Paracoccaceae bacterium]|nr:MAG: IclR family transcriptional regulator [Paracoccaceae bacterium]
MMAILDCFSTVERKLSAAEIAMRTGIPRGTVHRIMRTMRDLGLVDQERDRDQYRLGMKLFELGTTVLANMDLHREANASVEALTRASGETVHLSVFDGKSSTVINRTDPDGTRVNTLFVLESSPAHATASGKVALAHQPPAAIERFIARGLPRLAPNTITDPAGLRDDLTRIRERGYAIDNEELAPNTKCVAAPIRNATGSVFAAISVSGQARRFTPDRIAAYADLVRHHAQTISLQLGYRPETVRP